MARGRAYRGDTKEKAYAMWADGESMSAISKKLKVPSSTVRTWFKNKKSDEFDALRREKMRTRTIEEINNANEIIISGMAILKRRFERAIDSEDAIDRIIEEVAKSDISGAEKAAALKQLFEIRLSSLRDISTAVGVMCDKRERLLGRKETEDTAGGLVILPEVKEE